MRRKYRRLFCEFIDNVSGVLQEQFIEFKDFAVLDLCLWDINTCLRAHGKSISDTEFSDLPQLPHYIIHPHNQIDQIDISIEREQGEHMLQQLNNDQRHIHNTSMNAFTTKSDQKCYFVDGPAVTGKTVRYNTIVHNLQALGIKGKCMA